jgi:hypothetical protein
MKRAQLDFLK